MKLFRIAMIAFVLCLTLSLQVSAKIWEHPAGFSIFIPDNYSVEIEGDVLVAKDPTEELGIRLYAVENQESMEKAVDEAFELIKQNVTDVELGEGKESKLNGLDALFIDGTGKVGGTPADLSVALFHKNGKILVMYGAVNSAKASQFEADIVKILKSIK